MLVGDMNVNSCTKKTALEHVKASIIQERNSLTVEEQNIFDQAFGEYDTLIDILSKFDEEKITDCFQQNLERNHPIEEDEQNGQGED